MNSLFNIKSDIFTSFTDIPLNFSADLIILTNNLHIIPAIKAMLFGMICKLFKVQEGINLFCGISSPKDLKKQQFSVSVPEAINKYPYVKIS